MRRSAGIDCATARSRLALLPSGDLELPAARRLREHLAACGACRRELRGLLDAAAALAAATGPEAVRPGVPQPSEAFFAELERSIHDRLRRVGSERGAAARALRRVAAAAGLFLSGALFATWLTSGPEPLRAPLGDPSPVWQAAGVQTRPVGERGFAGLRGRAAADAWLSEVLGDLPATRPAGRPAGRALRRPARPEPEPGAKRESK